MSLPLTETVAAVDDAGQMRYEWDWTPAEHRRLQRAVFRSSSTRFLVHGVFAFCLLVLAWVVWLDVRRYGFEWVSVLPACILVAVWMFTLTWQLPRSGTRRQQRLHSVRRWLVIDPDGVQGGCETCSMRVEWGKVQRAVETKDFVLAFVSAGSAFWLPKRVVHGPDALRAIRETLRARLGPKARLRAV